MSAHPKYRIGGAEVQTHLLARELVGRGWHVSFTTYDWGQPDEVEQDEGVWIHKIKSRTGVSKAFWAWDLVSVMRKVEADIYVQRGGRPSTGLIAIFAALARRPFVWFQSQLSDCYGDKFVRRAKEKIKSRSPLRRVVSIGLAGIQDWLLRLGIRHANLVIVQAERYRELMEKHLGVDSLVVQNGHPVPQGVPPKVSPPEVVWIASLKPWKRPDLFVQLAKTCQDLDGRFIMAGPASQGWSTGDAVRQADALPNLEYLGKIPLEQANDLIGRASVLVNTSERHEGFPNTFIQAWLRATPVISLHFDPDDLMVSHNLGFHSQTFERMVTDVRKLIGSPSLQRELGEHARQFAAQRFDIERVGSELAGIFEELVEETGS